MCGTARTGKEKAKTTAEGCIEQEGGDMVSLPYTYGSGQTWSFTS